MIEQQCDGRDGGDRVSDLLARDVRCGAVDGLEHGREGAFRIDISGRCQAHAAGDCTGFVGQNVAEEVIGDHDVESTRIGDQEDRCGIYVEVIHGNFGVLGVQRLDRAAPEVTGVDQHVVLMYVGQLLAGARVGLLEGVAHHALDAERGIDGHLGCDLVRRALADHTAVSAVQALGALADHEEVDLTGVGERRGNTRVVLVGAQVDVVVQRKTQLKQQPALQHARWHGRIADRAEQDRVVLLDGFEILVGEGVTGCVPALSTEIVRRLFDSDVRTLQYSIECFEALGNNFGANSVAGNYGKINGACHEIRLARVLIRGP